ncbi:hypothetical protein AWENTII_007889 [Aspergillus wentii]
MAQAHIYNEAGTPVYTGPRAGTRIGKGVYMTEIAGQWRKPNSWYCQITAKYTEFQHTPKAWIPQYDSFGSLLWNGGEAAINRYIESLGHGWRPKYTIRLSELDEGAPKDENSILIPPALLEQNGGLLGLRAWCAPDVEEMGDNRADIGEWESVGGKRV